MNRRQFFRLGTFLLAAPGAVFQTACTSRPIERPPLIEYPVAGQAFPVLINHALGSVRIEQAPKRVVVIGVEVEDIAFGLGIVPVAIERNYWGGDENGYLPWFKSALETSGQKLPALFNMYPEPDIERLVAAKPDLILAQQSGVTPTLYQQLSAIAPVVAYPAKQWLTSVSDIIDTTAAALGKTAEATRLHAELSSIYANYRAQHPELQKYSFAYFYAAARMSHLSIYPKEDPRVDTLVQMGLRLSSFIDKLHVNDGRFTANIGLENADMLNDTDIVFTWFGSEEERKSLERSPLFASIAAVKRGSYLALTDKTLSTAMYYGTPLSLKWALPKFTPGLLEIIRELETAAGNRT